MIWRRINYIEKTSTSISVSKLVLRVYIHEEAKFRCISLLSIIIFRRGSCFGTMFLSRL